MRLTYIYKYYPYNSTPGSIMHFTHVQRQRI